MKIKGAKLQTVLFSILIMYSVVNISYLSKILHINGTLTLGIRVILITILNLVMIKNKRKFSKIYILLWGWWLLITTSSIINHRDIVYFISIQTRAMLICTCLEYYSLSPRKMICVLETWKNILIVLCLCDIITMIAYPNGLYISQDYSLNWFLGYKTARIVYTLPMAILICYLPLLKGKTISFISLCVITVSATGCLYSQATTGFIAVMLFTVVMYLCAIWRKSKMFKRSVSDLLKYKNIVIAYSILTILTIMGNSIVIYFSQNILGKSATLSHRTEIWSRCLIYFYKKPILGQGYLTTDEYVQYITLQRLGTNAHNMIVSVLLTVGILGLIIYFLIVKTAFIKNENNSNLSVIVLSTGFVTFLTIGLTSSALVFSPFAFMTLQLLYYNSDPSLLINDNNAINQGYEA